jgi:hypothetical protein
MGLATPVRIGGLPRDRHLRVGFEGFAHVDKLDGAFTVGLI